MWIYILYRFTYNCYFPEYENILTFTESHSPKTETQQFILKGFGWEEGKGQQDKTSVPLLISSFYYQSVANSNSYVSFRTTYL